MRAREKGEEKKEIVGVGGGEEEIWKASKVIHTRGESKMIMDNSKVYKSHRGAKIVHSRYFTTAARLAGRRGLGNTSRSTQREQCHLERKREREEDRIALYRSLILYIVPEKTKRARERSMYPHMQL